ncbi:hypothetical protein LN040_06970 [Desulfovibrio subterraneus]|jgi:hypothetical protein|uniref:Uncharacterized protein n=1 Tax=Desulfovibrio subterraneus TaxID=2718620 RepID=A0A7J0BES6_9BACT|nr:hypothetical protein [Desulfovibrio subterraneus]WBF68829.1 hypothetical protein LN040_06970 [Desulfovibrio subterraneus]GFM32028.1 hypothetical protein DSM101010T_03930 [Desulfovibrio subterraneus]
MPDIQFNSQTAGYFAIALLFLLTSTFIVWQRLARARESQMPEAGLDNGTPTPPDGLCATTLWIANYSASPVFIRNIHIDVGTFAGNEVRNLMGQIRHYEKSEDIQRPLMLTVEPQTRRDEPVAFHARVGSPVEAVLQGNNGTYDIHIRQLFPR